MSFLIMAEQLKLTKKEKEQIEKWHKDSDYKFSDKVFGKKDRITVPARIKEKFGDLVPLDISMHLKNHGYHSIDDSKFTAKDKHDREQNIGKALVRTKAPQEMIDKFSKLRKPSTKDLAITYSRHPIDVGAMSTSRGWKSCMNLRDDRKIWKKLEYDFKHGSHVAYIHHPHDTNIENPIARITLKPYVSHNGHKILRPEPKSYGNASSEFHDKVSDWAEKHFPLKKRHIYTTPKKNIYSDQDYGKMYHDESPGNEDNIIKNKNIGINTRIHHLEKMFDSNPKKALKYLKDPDYNRFIPHNKDLHRDVFIHTGNPRLAEHIKSLTPQEAFKTLQNNGDSLKTHLIRKLSKKIPDSKFKLALKYIKYPKNIQALEGKRKLSDSYYKQKMNHPNDKIAVDALDKTGDRLKNYAASLDRPYINQELMEKYPNDRELFEKLAKSKHFATLTRLMEHGYHDLNEQFKDHPDPSVINSLARYGTNEQISHVIKHHKDKLFNITKRHIAQKGNPEHIMPFIDEGDKYFDREATKHNIPHILDKFIDTDDHVIKYHIATHGHMRHLDKLVHDTDPYIREKVLEHGHPHHLEKLVGDADHNVRKAVARHNYLPTLDKLVNDPNEDVRAKVAKHGYLHHLDKLSDDESLPVKYVLSEIGHKHHLDKLLDSDIDSIKSSIISKGHPSHIQHYLKDSDNIPLLLNNAPRKYLPELLGQLHRIRKDQYSHITREEANNEISKSNDPDIRENAVKYVSKSEFPRLIKDTDPDVLNALLRRSDFYKPKYLNALAANRHLRPDRLAKHFYKEYKPEYHRGIKALLKNRHFSPFMAHKWSYDKNLAPYLLDYPDSNAVILDQVNRHLTKPHQIHRLLNSPYLKSYIADDIPLFHGGLLQNDQELANHYMKKHGIANLVKKPSFKKVILNSPDEKHHLQYAAYHRNIKLLKKLANSKNSLIALRAKGHLKDEDKS